ncbi:DUF4296 domain-containing protein [Galbibacter mesophilus]|uniref:DUF4296 domain-containing protein n=1 Tax=Galbibacter mesophilus TaxID=379069 RepID=UPI00191CEC89|nr:DUF4296 domain-containing protein [Galbibacter mesophilus]MCM5662148.1 DUF4296 domain-containing protein [Galbibacter mesophilus]
MRQVLLLLTVVLVVFSCNEDIVEKPENLIPKKTMVDIYYDISMLNATKATAINKLEEYEIDPQEFLFEKYNIDSTQLSKSSIYYTSNPAIQLEMFEEVEKRLQKLKDTLDVKLQKQREEKETAPSKIEK